MGQDTDPPTDPEPAPSHLGQRLFNLALFLFFAAIMVHENRKVWLAGQLGFVEISFALQNAVMVALILLRRPHRAISTNPLHQALALAAFLSGALFAGSPVSGGPSAALAATLITAAANVLGLVTLLNLGRSFGILIALRRVETRLLYSWVRHPMYGTDILLRVGFLVSHLGVYTALLFVLSSACYVIRALFEERFLAAADPAYAAYMQRTRWRFIPYLF